MRFTLGADIAVNGTFDADLTNWAGTNWAWETDGATGGWARHTAGNTAQLVSTAPASTAGVIYSVTYTIGGMTAGNCNVAIGGVTGTARAANGTYNEILTAANTASCRFVPTTGFDGYIDNVIIRVITYSNVASLDLSTRMAKLK